MTVQTIEIGYKHGGPRDEYCCICCPNNNEFNDNCYCNCCPCPPTGDLCFDMIACRVLAQTNVENQPCMCDDWSFILAQSSGVDMCYYHAASGKGAEGEPCMACPDTEYILPQFKNTGSYPEAWGFSGRVCKDPDEGCYTSDPMVQTGCEGMWFTSSLCCCRTGIRAYEPEGEFPTDHPCPIVSTGLHCEGPTSGGTGTCMIDCFGFEILPIIKNAVDTTEGLVGTPCSPCAYADMPGAAGPQPNVGEFDGGCGTIFSGQCACPSCDPVKKFMLLVSGEFLINCDCQTGVFTAGVINPPFPPTTPSIAPVTIVWSGCITEYDDCDASCPTGDPFGKD